MHRGAEDAEHPLMGPHVGQLIGHMVFHKVVFARQLRKFRAFFQCRLGAEEGLQLCAPAKLGAELPPLSQKAALGPAECPAGRQTAGVFDFCVFPAGDLLHPSFLQLPKHTKRTPAYLIRAGVFFKVY